MRTVGEVQRERGWFGRVGQNCYHYERKHFARGVCERCYGRYFGRKHRVRWAAKRLRGDFVSTGLDRMVRWIEEREARGQRIHVPWTPPRIPIGGWSLRWLWEGNGPEAGFYPDPHDVETEWRGEWVDREGKVRKRTRPTHHRGSQVMAEVGL